MPPRKGEDHPYNKLQKLAWERADTIDELRKELAETRQTAVFEAKLHDQTRAERDDYHRRLELQVAKHEGYQEAVQETTRLLLRCNDKRTGEGLSALFG